MACTDCVVSQSQLTLDFPDAGLFILTMFAEDGSAITFSEVSDNRDKKVRSNGDIDIAGPSTRSTQFVARVPCVEAEGLWNVWKSPQEETRNQLTCGTGNYVDNCCSDERWRTVTIDSIKRPDIGDTVDYFEITGMGVY